MILYIGNKLISKHKNVTGIVTLGELLQTEGYHIVSVSSLENQFLRLCSMVWAVFKHNKKIKHVLIDTYSTKNFYYALVISQLCKLFSIKYIPILRGGNLPERLDKSTKLSSLIFNNAYKNIAPSQYLQSEFYARGYKTMFIPNVLEIKRYKFQEREVIFPKLLYVRAFSEIYNPELAIRVLSVIKDTYPKALLCMIGPEKDASFKSCKNLVKSLGLEKNVEFTGMLSKPEWHKKAENYNIFINTTNVDNTPVSVMEAMALGLPVVSTNVGGIPYLINDRANGLLVEKNNVNHMVNAIIEICENEIFAKNLVRNARQYVEQFDWQKVKPLWQKVLQ